MIAAMPAHVTHLAHTCTHSHQVRQRDRGRRASRGPLLQGGLRHHTARGLPQAHGGAGRRRLPQLLRDAAGAARHTTGVFIAKRAVCAAGEVIIFGAILRAGPRPIAPCCVVQRFVHSGQMFGVRLLTSRVLVVGWAGRSPREPVACHVLRHVLLLLRRAGHRGTRHAACAASVHGRA